MPGEEKYHKVERFSLVFEDNPSGGADVKLVFDPPIPPGYRVEETDAMVMVSDVLTYLQNTYNDGEEMEMSTIRIH